MIQIVGKGFTILIPKEEFVIYCNMYPVIDYDDSTIDKEAVVDNQVYQDYGDIVVETKRTKYVISYMFHANEIVDFISSAIKGQLKADTIVVMLDNSKLYHDYGYRCEFTVVRKE